MDLTEAEDIKKRCLGDLINEDIHTWNSLCRQEINIKTYDNSIPIIESSKKLWNQQYFTTAFPKPSQPGGKKRLRPSEIQITAPRHDKRNVDELQKPAYIWMRHSLRKKTQSPSINLTIRRQASFRHITHSKKAECKKCKDDKKGTTLKKISKKDPGPHETDEKPKRGNKADKTPSKSSHESQLSKKLKSKSEANPESKDSIPVSIKHPKKDKRYSKDSKEMDFESISTKKYSKSSKNNSDAISETFSKNSSNVGLMMHLGESDAESMDFDMWLKNYSQNNSKKPTKKDAKKDAKGKGSDAESVDSKDAKKDAKKDKKGATKDTKKDAKKDAESTDAESGDSKDAKKGKKDDKKKDAKKDAASDAESGDSKDAKKDLKKGKKDSKKDDKKKDAKKDAESTDAESGDSKDAKKDLKKGKKDSKKDDKKKDAKKDAESTDAESGDSKDEKKDSKKGKKDSKKDDKKKDAKKDAVSTDADSESEGDAKKGGKDSKKDKKDLKKYDKKKSAMKFEESTETESDWESKKVKRDSKKDAKKSAKKDTESSDVESDMSSKGDLKKTEMFKSSDAESEESLFKPGPKKRVDESDATSTDSKKDAVELKRGIKMPSRRTTFKEKGKKKGTGRVPPSRERPPLPPCEPLLPSPRVKRLCRCQMPPPPPKPRYAPLTQNVSFVTKLINDPIV
ncbi:cylicin-1 [Muntiacus reevesi]|uniref:cylicin-1 n=1 Tax=Muntiacus reevesi TaxID=9886 RepID=UPI003307BB28